VRIIKKASAVAACIAISVSVVACSAGGGDSKAARSPEPTGEATAGNLDYVRPAVAKDTCGVIDGLIELNEQASTQDIEASVSQLGERLQLVAEGAGKLEVLAESEEEASQWSRVDARYSEAADFLAASGGQVSSDAFVALLGDAVAASNEAYVGLKPYAQEVCNVSIEYLVAER